MYLFGFHKMMDFVGSVYSKLFELPPKFIRFWSMMFKSWKLYINSTIHDLRKIKADIAY